MCGKATSSSRGHSLLKSKTMDKTTVHQKKTGGGGPAGEGMNLRLNLLQKSSHR